MHKIRTSFCFIPCHLKLLFSFKKKKKKVPIKIHLKNNSNERDHDKDSSAADGTGTHKNRQHINGSQWNGIRVVLYGMVMCNSLPLINGCSTQLGPTAIVIITIIVFLLTKGIERGGSNRVGHEITPTYNDATCTKMSDDGAVITKFPGIWGP